MSAEEEIVPTKCEDWSLNVDAESKRRFWWNATYSISLWEESMVAGENVGDLDDTDIWKKYIEFQLRYVFKLCPICRGPQGHEDMGICCYCGNTVHGECSVQAAPEQIAWKPANAGFERFMRVCYDCQDVSYNKDRAPPQKVEGKNAKHAAQRMLSLKAELPGAVIETLQQLRDTADTDPMSPVVLADVTRITTEFFQSPESLKFLKKGKIASKGGGIGVIAAQDVPAFTIIGAYPGYADDLSGEQAKVGRPVPKYALMELNCADFFNDVFDEFSGTFTPFINEPCENEVSNCAWIQEPGRPEGRLSIISVKEVKKGDELLIGYGPLYPRNYPFSYDAYAFHPVEGYHDPLCYALWHWPSTEEKDCLFVCYVGYVKDKNRYIYWESEAEYEEKMRVLNSSS